MLTEIINSLYLAPAVKYFLFTCPVSSYTAIAIVYNTQTVSTSLITVFIVLCVGKIKGKSVLLFPYCTLQRCKRAIFAQVCCIFPSSGKYSTLAKYMITSHHKHRLLTSFALPFASITTVELD